MNSTPGVFSAIFWLCLESCMQVSWMCSISVTCSKTVTMKSKQGPMTFFFPNTLTALWKYFLLKGFLKYFSYKCDNSEVRCWCTPLSEYNTSASNLLQVPWHLAHSEVMSQDQNLTSIQQHKFQCAKTKQGSEDCSHHSRSTYHPCWVLPCFHQP